MIPSDQHQAGRRLAIQLRHEIIVQSLGRLRRISRIKDIPGDQDHVDLQFHHLVQQPVQEALLLLLPGLLIKHLPQMPVGGVQNTKCAIQLLTHRGTIYYAIYAICKGEAQATFQ